MIFIWDWGCKFDLSKRVFSLQDVVIYLEDKVLDNSYTDDEYAAYIRWKKEEKINKGIYLQLYNEMLDEYIE